MDGLGTQSQLTHYYQPQKYFLHNISRVCRKGKTQKKRCVIDFLVLQAAYQMWFFVLFCETELMSLGGQGQGANGSSNKGIRGIRTLPP